MPDLPTFFHSWPQFLITAGVMTVAEMVYTSFGFGAGLIAVGSLAIVLPEVRDVVVMLLLVNAPVELCVIATSHRAIAWRGVGLVAAGVVLGTPVGTRLLKLGGPTFILTLLGGFLVVVGMSFLALREGARVRWPGWTGPAAGASSGVLAGLFGTGGPPLILYYQLAGVDKTQFRGNLMAIFLLLTILRIPNYLLEGLITTPRVVSSLAILPAVGIGAWIGSRIHVELSEAAFRRLVSVVLMIIGVTLLLRR